ncbi:hypothetical protein pmac_cds_883 [Pandoravirus macleodensis]|uniref:Uncharacterized protein n=1 Tax=Pandoravirus macleodensis TaxID=2107707 RepID=A0A2U7UI10_9VIRU|nr:hypothetical protein pmac_cds_883 [Pandoravirus macleodensis]AVK77571.1 hypothetical protein pmac_cds_883 [Pandoravirus macleodensis]UMO80383.1 hypothetical protein [Pandoravirus aubagnensis]
MSDCTASSTVPLAQSTTGDHPLSVRKRKRIIVGSDIDPKSQYRHHGRHEMSACHRRCANADCLCDAPHISTGSATHETLERLRSAASIDRNAPLVDARPHASTHANLVALLRWARAVLYEDDVPDDAVGPRQGTDAQRDRDYIMMRAASRAFAASDVEWRSIGAAPGRVRDATPGNEIVARALWTVERLEAGMTSTAAVHSAAQVRLEAVASVRRLSPCRAEADVTTCTDGAPWCRAVAIVGTAYRSAMRRRLVRIYVAYAPVAAEVDRMRDMGDEAPDGDIPTPRSVRAWLATRGNDSSTTLANDDRGSAARHNREHAGPCKRIRLAPPVSVCTSSDSFESARPVAS